MKPLRVLLLLVLFCAGCSDPREVALDRLHQQGEEKLRREAMLLYKQKFSSHGTDFQIIRPKEWPPSFVAIDPLRVSAYPDGISLAIQIRNRKESGLYVVPVSMDHVPRAVEGVAFEKLSEGIYWYSFGN